MNKKTQMIVGLVAVAGIGYWIWKSQKSKGFSNFTKNTNSTMGKTKGCRLVDGGVNIGPLPFRLGSGEYIISATYTGGPSGLGQTLVCPDIPRGSSSGVVL
jgi:hypothetical protein